jgi:GT2 family glycosyltransferase
VRAKTHDAPVLTSIIIPVFNKVEYTFQALRALLREVDLEANEIIVVNNASRDETAQLLAHLGSLIKVINNEENRGFVDACNQGAQAARGRYLIFLNNDTQVLPDWWQSLVETVARDERVGAVGSLFLYPDGLIQEAGAIVWRDGAAFHYGWGWRADDRRCNFAREVDYCSGASLLIRKELFDQLGGFDRRFAPAYYEDIDLCMGVRARGYKVIFQPASRLIHYEGVTAGRDTGAGFKGYQLANRAKFVEKWRDVLAREHQANDRAHVERAANRKGGPRIVVFDERIPTPDRDAGSARMLFILRTLNAWARVVFVPMNRPEWPEYERRLWREGIETARVADYRRLLRERKFYAGIVSRPSVAAALVPALRRAGLRVVFDMVDAYFLRLEREHAVTNDPAIAAEAARYRKLETKLARQSDLVWCNSTEDKRAMVAVAPKVRIEVIPTIHELHARGLSFRERAQLLFIGNLAHRPNSDGVQHFLREVWPLVRARLPEIALDIVGDNPPAEVAAYSSTHVRVHGYVPDVEPFWHSRRVFVAPLRYGAGVKGKVGESLAHGLPCVTTTIGAEGMGLTHNESAMIADTPQAFADAIVALYTDGELWQRLADAGQRHIAAHFTPEVCAPIINDSIKALDTSQIALPAEQPLTSKS